MAADPEPARPRLPAWLAELDSSRGFPPAKSPFTPVEFTGLMVTPYLNDAKRLAYSLKATGVRAPSRGMARPAAEDHLIGHAAGTTF